MIPIQIGKQKRHPLRRAVRGVLWFVLLALLAVLVVSFLFNRITRQVPPRGPAPGSTLAFEGRRVTYGPSSLEWHGGAGGAGGGGAAPGSIWTLRLRGDPYRLGYSHGALGNRLLMAVDDHMFDMMERFMPSPSRRWLAATAVRWRYRELGDHTPAARRLELAGMASAFHDRHRREMPTYQRLLYYHATHEITQSLEHSPLLGCSAFAAFGPATQGGHLIIGRNFDFEGGAIFDREKAVVIAHADGRIPFTSIAWVGFTGVVTGVNAEGIFVSVNAARTDDKSPVGMPIAFLAREVLEQARTLDEAISILKQNRTMVSNAFLVGDGKAMTAVVVEKSPTRFAVRRGKDAVWVANHLLAQEFAKDGENDRLRRYLTSGHRHRRLTDLMQGQRGLDVRRAQELLRDRKAAAGGTLGLGNRNAIDALIATHSVVVDATALTLYVSQEPHTLGRYRAYDLRAELRGEETGNAPADLPEDPLLGSQAYADLGLARNLLGHARFLESLGERRRAIDAALQAVGLAPALPDTHKLLGDLYRRAGDGRQAREAYERFLALEPPYLAEVEEVNSFLGSP
jgi:isopenicillin-N N-acyltransferase like protein